MREIKRLNDKLKKELREYLVRDLRKNVLYLYDLDKEYPSRADFFILKENERLKGFGVVWADNPNFSYLHLIAENENDFLDLLTYSIKEGYINKVKRIIIPIEYSSFVEKILRIPGEPLDLMYLKKGDEKELKIKHYVRRLGNDDITNITNLLREFVELYLSEDEKEFGKGIIKSVENSVNNGLFFGCFINNELASFVRANVTYPPFVFIDTLYTRKNLQRMGAAISVVSALIEELFYKREEFNEIQLYEMSNNLPAHDLYSRLGFKILKKFMRYSNINKNYY